MESKLTLETLDLRERDRNRKDSWFTLSCRQTQRRVARSKKAKKQKNPSPTLSIKNDAGSCAISSTPEIPVFHGEGERAREREREENEDSDVQREWPEATYLAVWLSPQIVEFFGCRYHLFSGIIIKFYTPPPIPQVLLLHFTI